MLDAYYGSANRASISVYIVCLLLPPTQYICVCVDYSDWCPSVIIDQ